MHPLEQLRDDALAQIASAPDQRVLETVRVKFLGRGGSVSEWSDKMKSLPKEEKPAVGKLLNEVRVAITAVIEARAENFRAEKESARWPILIFRFRAHPMSAALFIRSPRCSTAVSRFSGEWGSR